MDNNRAKGIESLAIPHNSNGSDGWMFQKTNWAGIQWMLIMLNSA